ncbi:hypothetical protein N7533_012851 [Penicillium manginii]|jgi:6-phosphogluconate dehydrogenase|uniref:uncharacterized protein n=1 Tax=Penicillium manginii TaxID=203109 RepID=UPI002547D92A|nr:uncharacterized protein N7533_012851 [Penicillium manginii]KAJ5740067.1 hypothetical protein N7533_012851 [Penicillium manginii]
MLDKVLDKVVQDDDDTEETPHWAIKESASSHISTPTLTSAYYLRVASGDREEMLAAAKTLRLPKPNLIQGINRKEKESLVDDLHDVLYCTFLSSSCQGLELIN